MTKLGLSGTMRSIRPARGFEDTKLVGPALTLEIKPSAGFDGKSLSPYDIYADAEAGQVSVVAGNGIEKIYTGDNQATLAKTYGLAGFVIDGGARDIAGIRRLGMPLWYKGSQTTSGGTVVSAVNVPVTAGGVLVNPGDIIVADEDGVVVIPAEKLNAVMEQVAFIKDIEEALELLIKDKAPLAEIRALLAQKSAPVS